MALLHCDFFSEVLGMASSMDVILPQETGDAQIGMKGHGRSSDSPVLYLLHGHSDDHTIWQRRTNIERYVAEMGLAVIMPNAHRSFYTDMAFGYKYWTFISEELPAIAQRFFHLSARRADTFVAGLSMGGYGAFKLALRHRGRFAAAASLSGALDIAARQQIDDPTGNPTMSLVFGEPGSVRGTADDLFVLAAELAEADGPRPLLYQCCGTEDFLYEDNLRFRDHVLGLGLPLTYEEGPGEHEWGYWDQQIQRVLAWLPLAK
jgi:S-formylglutathione hydrolase FrmB